MTTRASTHAAIDQGTVCFSAAGQPGLRLSSSHPLTLDDNAAVASFTLNQGEGAEFVLGGQDDERVDSSCTDLALAHTLTFWRGWIAQSNYRGRWREMVNRSALALKLLTSRKHGAIIAAATFGLPETPGGERNWDYRYTWIRDASFTVYAFMRLGFVDEANAYMRWLRGGSATAAASRERSRSYTASTVGRNCPKPTWTTSAAMAAPPRCASATQRSSRSNWISMAS
jgi:GH15 family glucan-1,4-alpha-glucosidase